ncbi:MAG: DciA family protein [Immundisolibacter sp.]|uniref:DciA family protein n=1 Tax=Immundisolibacter sp. TaxID=1934948 RepID=UPI003EE3833A
MEHYNPDGHQATRGRTGLDIMGSQEHLHKLLAARNGPLAALLHASQQHAALAAQIKRCLPPEVAAVVHSAVLNHGCLSLGVSNSAWASRLRFMAPQIRAWLAGWPHDEVTAIEVHVLVATQPAPATAADTPRSISASTRAHLEAVAQTSTDPRLAAALRALAQSGRGPGDDNACPPPGSDPAGD